MQDKKQSNALISTFVKDLIYCLLLPMVKFLECTLESMLVFLGFFKTP